MLIYCKKGIEYLTSKGLIEGRPAEVAEFMFNAEGLNKAKLGEFLGKEYVYSFFLQSLSMHNWILILTIFLYG